MKAKAASRFLSEAGHIADLSFEAGRASERASEVLLLLLLSFSVA